MDSSIRGFAMELKAESKEAENGLTHQGVCHGAEGRVGGKEPLSRTKQPHSGSWHLHPWDAPLTRELC